MANRGRKNDGTLESRNLLKSKHTAVEAREKVLKGKFAMRPLVMYVMCF